MSKHTCIFHQTTHWRFQCCKMQASSPSKGQIVRAQPWQCVPRQWTCMAVWLHGPISYRLGSASKIILAVQAQLMCNSCPNCALIFYGSTRITNTNILLLLSPELASLQNTTNPRKPSLKTFIGYQSPEHCIQSRSKPSPVTTQRWDSTWDSQNDLWWQVVQSLPDLFRGIFNMKWFL